MKSLPFDDPQGEYDPKAQALQDALDRQNEIKQTNVALDNQFNDQSVPPVPLSDIPATSVPSVASDNTPSSDEEAQSPVSRLQSLLGNREPSAAPQPKPIKSSIPEPILRQLATSGNEHAKKLLTDAYGPELGDSALKQALAQKNQNTDLVGMGAAANQLAKGLAAFGGGEFNPDTPELKLAEKQAGQPVEDILTRRQGQDEQLKHQMNLYGLSSEKEKSDPNSQVSKMAQDLLGQMSSKVGMKIDPSGMSLASVEKVFGPMEKYFSSIEAQKSRQMAQNDKLDQKKFEQVVKYNKAMGEDLDPSRARSGNLGKLQQVISDTRALEALTSNYSNLDKIPAVQYAEMASALDRLVSRGNPTIERFRHMMPSNLALSGAGMMQWVQSKPQGANQGAFIKSILNTANSERKVAQDQILEAQVKKANSTHRKLKEMSPEDFYQTLATATGLSQDELMARESGENKHTEFTDDVLKFAKDHNITPEKALEIKIKRTQGQ